jgi:hypothetical protein
MALTIIDDVPGSPTPDDLFQPHMPGVAVLDDMDTHFARAREQSANGPEGRCVVIVTPGRLLMSVPTPPLGSMPESAKQTVRAMLHGDRPLDVSIVSYTRLEALMADEQVLKCIPKCIPLFGHLLVFTHLGHRVVVFEGHPTAFEAGVRNADVLLVDSGMLPFLQEDWAAVAFRVMKEGARILVHERKHDELMPVVQQKEPPGWQYTEPDGEASYVNCLLTTISLSPNGSVRILAGARLPDLARIATDPEQLEWIASLPFDYAWLDAEKVIEMLMHVAKPVRTGLFRRELVLKAKFAMKGTITDFAFKLTPGRTPGGRQTLQVDRM